jgi:hypothetical protein
VRPPHVRLLACALLLGCSPDPRASTAALHVATTERPVLVGDVVERLDGQHYVYLRLSIVSDSAQLGRRPRPRQRWVALEQHAPQPGERIRVRSLAQRSRVWDPSLERDFVQLDYVARVDR